MIAGFPHPMFDSVLRSADGCVNSLHGVQNMIVDCNTFCVDYKHLPHIPTAQSFQTGSMPLRQIILPAQTPSDPLQCVHHGPERRPARPGKMCFDLGLSIPLYGVCCLLRLTHHHHDGRRIWCWPILFMPTVGCRRRAG